ncbi:hypothetical protein KGA66_05935 [Actinocrinis puniceicyclus]|uniref:MmpS family membrane protein n=1 Tax=Actinocrinis puniceicyclus TaxID=977794 RepID=A0A8J7WHZ7_9ACTN|nr:hypothetical protein [Actinocrinis puniceicyclus]MBS2962578.1 hypothetical protein [Actinocrinis puniceicyclus]
MADTPPDDWSSSQVGWGVAPPLRGSGFWAGQPTGDEPWSQSQSQPPRQSQPYALPTPPRRRWPWILLGVLLPAVGGCVATIVALTAGVHGTAKTEHVLFKVTGDAKSVTVVYTTWNNETASTDQRRVTLPWTTAESTDGLLKGGMLTVIVGVGGGTATCSVAVDDGAPKTATASGAFSTTTCQLG